MRGFFFTASRAHGFTIFSARRGARGRLSVVFSRSGGEVERGGREKRAINGGGDRKRSAADIFTRFE